MAYLSYAWYGIEYFCGPDTYHYFIINYADICLKYLPGKEVAQFSFKNKQIDLLLLINKHRC